MLVFACVAIFPLFRSTPALGDEGVTLRAVSYNIKHGLGMDGKLDLKRTGSVLDELEADVVALQEVDRGVNRSGSVDQPEELAKQLKMHAAFGSFMELQGGQYGLAILSRHPIVREHVIRLPRGNEPRVALAVEVRLPNAAPLMVVNLHFDWVSDDSFRFDQARALNEYLATLKIPYLLMGDFNDVPESRTLKLFSENSLEVAKPAEDRFTFSSVDPKKEIDFLFVHPKSNWTVERVRVIDEALASDHRPVAATLTIRVGE
ncbi:metallophosphoesterase [Roseiconus nitratireducens]|uniref:Metallophosphoesterase n=2 Tax=Roseiconus nitratireducens TaxID=2605748 RepID=A0A5M6D359_9BACT|nr:metallophosphoesterase [Roseiconus nitratireducens]